jgi:EAL domain-containing protein (putative c-di-GMP-specific phosphodiesterase class I)
VRTPPPDAYARTGHRTRLPRASGLPGVARGAEARVAYVRVALRDDRLRLVSQPIVDLRTGAQVAEELLLRFVRRDGSIELPGPYVCAAERFHLAVELDAWVLERAVRLAAAGRRVHMNVSGRTIVDWEFGDRIEDCLALHGADPSLLTFEITETAPALDLPRATCVAERIAALGASVALDDFGTGYGSLSYLLRLPIHVVKIDRDFVADVVSDGRPRALVESVVHLARRLGQVTVAEGVENQATLDVLRECGVDHAQGFHIGGCEPI